MSIEQIKTHAQDLFSLEKDLSDDDWAVMISSTNRDIKQNRFANTVLHPAVSIKLIKPVALTFVQMSEKFRSSTRKKIQTNDPNLGIADLTTFTLLYPEEVDIGLEDKIRERKFPTVKSTFNTYWLQTDVRQMPDNSYALAKKLLDNLLGLEVAQEDNIYAANFNFSKQMLKSFYVRGLSIPGREEIPLLSTLNFAARIRLAYPKRFSELDVDFDDLLIRLGSLTKFKDTQSLSHFLSALTSARIVTAKSMSISNREISIEN